MFWAIMAALSAAGLVFLGVHWYANRVNALPRRGRVAPVEPVSDRYGVEMDKVRSAESMREAAAHVCRLVSRDAANKARLANEAAHNPRLTQEERNAAVSRQKAWLYTCEAAERCEREIRKLGLRASYSPVVVEDVQDT